MTDRFAQELSRLAQQGRAATVPPPVSSVADRWRRRQRRRTVGASTLAVVAVAVAAVALRAPGDGSAPGPLTTPTPAPVTTPTEFSPPPPPGVMRVEKLSWRVTAADPDDLWVAVTHQPPPQCSSGAVPVIDEREAEILLTVFVHVSRSCPILPPPTGPGVAAPEHGMHLSLITPVRDRPIRGHSEIDLSRYAGVTGDEVGSAVGPNIHPTYVQSGFHGRVIRDAAVRMLSDAVVELRHTLARCAPYERTLFVGGPTEVTIFPVYSVPPPEPPQQCLSPVLRVEHIMVPFELRGRPVRLAR